MSPSTPAGKDYVDARFCAVDREIVELKMTVSKWSKWFMGAMLSILGGVIFVAGFIWSVDSRADEVEKGVGDVQESVEKITDKVNDLVKTQERVKDGLDKKERRESERQDNFKKVMREAIQEALENPPPRRRKNRGE